MQQLADVGGAPRWSPDGSTIAFLSYDPSWRATIEIFDEVIDVPVLSVGLLDVETGRDAPAPRRPGRHGVEPPDVDVGG